MITKTYPEKLIIKKWGEIYDKQLRGSKTECYSK